MRSITEKSGEHRGFTVIELLIVVVVMAILIAIAAPSLRTMIIGNQIRSVAGDLVSDMAISRSEASKRSLRVVLCKTDNQSTCNSGATWNDGWIAFVDADGNGQRDTGTGLEPLIRVKQAMPTSVAINAGGLNSLQFRAIGIAGAVANITICPATTGTGIAGRNIVMTVLGKVQSTTATTCT